MLSISPDHTLNSWFQIVSGDGAVNVTGGVANCSSGAGTGSGYIRRSVPVKPGETVIFSIMARVISSGSGGTEPRIGLNYPGETSLRNSVVLSGREWREYSITYTAPLTADVTPEISCTAGVWTSLSGEAEFTLPRIEVKNAVYGAPRVVAHGMIALDGSATPTLNDNYAQGGIKSLAYSAGELTIGIDGFQPGLKTAPLPWLAMTAAGAPEILPKESSFSYSTGEFVIKFLDVTTGAFVVPSFSPTQYLIFKAEV